MHLPVQVETRVLEAAIGKLRGFRDRLGLRRHWHTATVTAMAASASTLHERLRPFDGVTTMSLGFFGQSRVAMGILLISVSLAACGRGQTPIPAGAQQVHVSVVGSEVRLEPATASAGDIYIVLDTPGSGVGFAQRKRTAQDVPGPLTDEDLDRLAHGDTEGTAIGGFDDHGCSPEQRAQDHGRMGPCGNVFKIVVTPGTYAFFTGNLEGEPGASARSITVLAVVP